MKMNKILGLLCAVLMLFVPLTFAGCNSASYQYSDLNKLYNEIVYSNSDIFENDGTVRIVYNNATLNNLIQVNEPENQFNKLSGDSTKSYAIFEPTFRASMLVVQEFIKKPYIDQSKFDKKHTTRLYNKLLEFKASIEKFKETKSHLENRSSIDANSVTIKSWRNDLFLDYYNMIDVSCDFALDFADFYESNVLDKKKVGERYISNYMKLDYLRMVTEFARITTDTIVYGNYNRVVTSTYDNISVELMNLYLSIPNDVLWTNSDASLMTDAEKNIMNAFDVWQDYKLVFYQAKSVLYNALSIADYNNIYYESTKSNNALTIQEQNVLDQVERFINCERANMYSYINSFTTILKNFINE